jgi:hypothetical protein
VISTGLILEGQKHTYLKKYDRLPAVKQIQAPPSLTEGADGAPKAQLQSSEEVKMAMLHK